jgi:hypothetical protein
MKKLVLSVLLLFPVLSMAQESRVYGERLLINRSDIIQIDQKVPKTGNSNIWSTKPLIQTAPSKSFKVVLSDTSADVVAGRETILHGTFINNTDSVIKLIFKRTHLTIDSNWTSSICLNTCYLPTTDSITEDQAYAMPKGINNDQFQFHIFRFAQDFGQDSVVDYIKLIALTGDPGDTISFIMKGVLNTGEAVRNKKSQSTFGPRIKAVYPSPLVEGNTIKVNVSSSKETGLSYSIFDAVGRTVGFGSTRQRINIGDNTISIGSLDGLNNGSYMLKFNFGDGSTDTHFFQVMR